MSDLELKNVCLIIPTLPKSRGLVFGLEIKEALACLEEPEERREAGGTVYSLPYKVNKLIE